MTRRRTRRRWAALLLSGMVLAAGCGTNVADPQTPAPSSRTSVTAPQVPVSPMPDSATPTTPTSGSTTSSSTKSPARPSTERSASGTAGPTASSSSAVKVTSTLVAGSGGVLAVTPADLAAATTAVAKMTTEQRAASVLMPTAVETIAAADPAATAPGGVIVMGSLGVPDGTADGTPDQVADLVQRVQATRPDGAPPLLVATDQEYGDVVRLVNGFTEFPGASELAAIPDTERAVELAEQIAGAAAAEMLAVGITVDFAPVADLLPADGSSSAIGDRSFGSDPERVARLVTAAVIGYQQAGLAATIKHFPGIGGIDADTHESLPTMPTECEQWNVTDAVPMRAGVQAGTALAMTGHVLMPAVGVTDAPASLSPAVVTDLLKGTGRDGCTGLEFRGIAVTDSMQMQPVLDADGAAQPAVVAALLAGEDLLLMPSGPANAAATITAAVESGELPADRLTDAATKVYALRLALARVPKPSLDVVGSTAHAELADAAGAAVRGG